MLGADDNAANVNSMLAARGHESFFAQNNTRRQAFTVVAS
jgi:hypothetical protein